MNRKSTCVVAIDVGFYYQPLPMEQFPSLRGEQKHQFPGLFAKCFRLADRLLLDRIALLISVLMCSIRSRCLQ